ncbi:hypothetical protein RASY3_09495 [Ruminococcus albus SY3]|uniref:Uncharacterized protein n=1 Tax=Ruminococcus albus SY3 TaxID=1341156 RepID=A0A011VYA4_RUMAL|nr:hypothetical protein RASY3_09495 [Ruminococcus albus SY3]
MMLQPGVICPAVWFYDAGGYMLTEGLGMVGGYGQRTARCCINDRSRIMVKEKTLKWHNIVI